MAPRATDAPHYVKVQVFDALQRWADNDLRSLNGQIEYLLREALRERQRLSRRARVSGTTTSRDEA